MCFLFEFFIVNKTGGIQRVDMRYIWLMLTHVQNVACEIVPYKITFDFNPNRDNAIQKHKCCEWYNKNDNNIYFRSSGANNYFISFHRFNRSDTYQCPHIILTLKVSQNYVIQSKKYFEIIESNGLKKFRVKLITIANAESEIEMKKCESKTYKNRLPRSPHLCVLWVFMKSQKVCIILTLPVLSLAMHIA